MPGEAFKQAIKNQRVDIDRCIKYGKHLADSLHAGKAYDELQESLKRLKEAKMWLGKALEEMGHAVPEEYRDEHKEKKA